MQGRMLLQVLSCYMHNESYMQHSQFMDNYISIAYNSHPSYNQGWKCRDISSIYRVSGLPDTISANNSQLKEKSKNISQYTIYRRYISYLQMQSWNKNYKILLLGRYIVAANYFVASIITKMLLQTIHNSPNY